MAENARLVESFFDFPSYDLRTNEKSPRFLGNQRASIEPLLLSNYSVFFGPRPGLSMQRQFTPHPISGTSVK